MGLLSLTLPTIGQPNSTEDPDVRNNFNLIQTEVNGNLEETNFKTSVKEKLGLTDGVVRRGSTVISTTESRSNTAYGLMTTPDRVSGITIPAGGGVIGLLYQAYWNESVDGAARAAIFLGSNQLKLSQVGVAAPAVQETFCAGSASITQPLSSCCFGINGWGGASIATGHAAPVTTGQVFTVHNSGGSDAAASNFGGGPAYIFADAGTYDVSIQFKASSGSVNVLNRRLYVWVVGF